MWSGLYRSLFTFPLTHTHMDAGTHAHTLLCIKRLILQEWTTTLNLYFTYDHGIFKL